MYDNNQAAFRDCCNEVRLGSEWGEEFGALNKRRVMPKNKKNIKGRPSSAFGTQTATATKVANFRKYPLSKTPKTRVLT